MVGLVKHGAVFREFPGTNAYTALCEIFGKDNVKLELAYYEPFTYQRREPPNESSVLMATVYVPENCNSMDALGDGISLSSFRAFLDKHLIRNRCESRHTPWESHVPGKTGFMFDIQGFDKALPEFIRAHASVCSDQRITSMHKPRFYHPRSGSASSVIEGGSAKVIKLDDHRKPAPSQSRGWGLSGWFGS